MITLLEWIDWGIYIFLAISVGYVLLYAIASKFRKKTNTPIRETVNKIAIIIPAYKEDKVIEATVDAVNDQTYNHDSYDVFVISQHMDRNTNEMLEKKCNLVKFDRDNSSKAKAMQYFMTTIDPSLYDYVVILDGDNIVDENFLSEINDRINCGIEYIQAHRISKNSNSSTSMLDGVSEEINNSIYRKGHNNLGLSSALIGSGMIFPMRWFAENINKVYSAGEDKELEILLHLQNIKVHYFEEVYVLDEKVAKDKAFYNQRRRWLAAQYATLFGSLKHLPRAVITGNIDLCDKIAQWIMPPLVILLGLIVIFSMLTIVIEPIYSIKWGILLLLFVISMFLAIPAKLLTKDFFRATLKIPLIFILMIGNMFRIKGASKNFIHTDHGE